MKLLLDQNLSPYLERVLADMYIGIAHVQSLGFGSASDEQLWDYAREHASTIVSKDADFSERVLLRGFPPKALWIRTGNCSTARIEKLLRGAQAEVLALCASASEGILELL